MASNVLGHIVYLTVQFNKGFWSDRKRFNNLLYTMKFLVLDILSVYKMVISPFLPPACRFEPTCSEYMREAVERYGALKGTWKGVKRILRCQPFCKGGHDPVR